MSTVPPEDQQQDAFDRLLAAMPDIATAVNAFDSKSTKRMAMQALVRAIGVPLGNGAAAPDYGKPDEDTTDEAESTSAPPAEPSDIVAASGSAPRPRSRRRRSGATPVAVKDFDFWPDGKQSLKELSEQKKPATIDHKNALVVYWFDEVIELAEITAGHVAAAYKAMDWREPSDLVNSLQATASREHWLNTGNTNAIKITPGGRNFVRHDLPKPVKKAAKKS